MERRPGGIRSSSLAILLGLAAGGAGEIARREPTVRLLGDLWVTSAVVEQAGARALAQLRDFHRRHPSEPGMPLETLRHGLRASEEVVEAALGDFARAGRLRLREGLVVLAGFVPKVAGGDAEIDRVVRILADAHLTPPSVAELEQSTGRHDLLALLRLAATRGQVEAVERDRYYVPAALDQFVEVLSEMGRQGPIIPAAVRDRLGISRKYLIPLLEWADIRGITVREADGRRLKTKV
jgi:selenocysteine-specific elongation factor